ncbi:MAG: hypothetical protein UX09_C0018G0021 [Candidatus Uhrbacteria bacterium GW2011_GWE2_45_35]|uniref:Uncharacterized protein n=2 Tax=Candidatus Uhriibacteriota TaxID=1752732 RepID=A0A0G1LS60_9BACT|nr:MAG: hypothetical protein UW63_C0010G0013 [Candidatus Uhrbacteria bacterium GW2011_GWF2_44_350]KKU08394.1 MAG: hypothetical protein UX09_C0018G0021 [Candidatus Uhrbacteria bacterium GW2011_GWE2_45_35]HBR80511.1 hypothetical protein [Candidatus Uhrbacteria bacterium]HCU31707.1 hypothetical protein [Candidatus Uhrbacteria bacterium]
MVIETDKHARYHPGVSTSSWPEVLAPEPDDLDDDESQSEPVTSEVFWEFDVDFGALERRRRVQY